MASNFSSSPYRSDGSMYSPLSKAHLRQARVVNQVDRKFIACMIEEGEEAGGVDQAVSLGLQPREVPARKPVLDRTLRLGLLDR